MRSPSLKGFLQEKSAARGANGEMRVYLAAFGKHPGWNDHIDDLGFETQSLVIAKRFVYLEGIASQIDTGAWDRLEPAARFGSFDHYLLWQRGPEILCAVLVDSRDGKGRTRYPMVLCLHAIGVPLDRVTSEFAPIVDRAMLACKAVATADEVAAILDAARGELRRRLAAPPEVPPVHAALVDHPALGPANEGLFRLLYQVKSQFGAWTRGSVDYEDEETLPRPASLRAPQAAGDFASGAGAWLDVFRAQLGEEPPVLLLWPRSAPWFDVVVGAPDPSAFFALKAGPGAIPLATEVPYQIDDAFRTEALAAALEFPRGAQAAKTIFGADAPVARKRNLTGLQLGRAKRAMAERGRSVSGWWSSWSPAVVRALVAVFLFLVLGVAGLIYWATRSVEDSKPGRPSSPPGAAGNVDSATLTAWREFCTASYEWFGRLNGELRDPARRTRWKQDAELRERVVEKIEAHEKALANFSPQQLTGTSGAAQTLSTMQPAALAKPDVAAKIRQAADIVHDVAKALREWGLPARMEAVEKRLMSRGWAAPATEISRWRGSLQLDGHVARAVDDLLLRQKELKLLSQKLDEIEAWPELAAAQDPFLAGWLDAAGREAREAKTVSELRESLFRRTEGMTEVLAILRDPALDRTALTAEPALTYEAPADSAAQVSRWVERARSLTALPNSERPLAESSWNADSAPLRRALAALQQLARDESATLAAAFDELDRRYAAYRQQPALRRDLARLREAAASLEADRASLERRLDAEVGRRTNPSTWIAALRETKIEGSAAASAEWQRRRDALVASAGAPQGVEAFLALQRAAARAEEFLRAAARAPELPTQLAGAEIFNAVVQRRRELAIDQLLKLAPWTNGQPEKTWAEFIASPEARKVVAEFRTESGEIAQFAAWMSRVSRQLDSLADFAAVAAADRTVPAADADVLGVKQVEDFSERLRNLKRIADSTDRSALVREAGADDLAVALQAWRGLGRLKDWPAGGREIRTEQGLRERIGRLAIRLDHASLKNALTNELQDEARRRWTVAAAQARQPDDWNELFSSAKSSGVDVAALGARERYNEWLWRLKQVPWRTFNGDEFSARRSALLAELAKLPPPVSSPEPWVRELEKIPPEAVPIDLAKVGPGAAGWKLVENADALLLSYEWTLPGAQTVQRLDFRQLEPVVDRPVYLATTELSVGLFLAWAEGRSLWTDLLAPMRDFVEDATANPKQELRRGPRAFVYNVGTKKLALAPSWVARNGYYPPDNIPPPPNANTPVNYLPPGTAELFARSLNCRLPSVAEWLSAYRTVSARALAGAAGAAPNRRDVTWQKQADFVLAQEVGKERLPPDEDAFYPPNVFPIAGIINPRAVNEDDGVLWFREVGQGRAESFLNLVGNVAEFVVDGAGPAARRAVIGGSALSVAEVDVAVAYPTGARSYSDVGVRLAFTIDRLTPGQRAAQIIYDAPYRN